VNAHVIPQFNHNHLHANPYSPRTIILSSYTISAVPETSIDSINKDQNAKGWNQFVLALKQHLADREFENKGKVRTTVK
jgi:hypothetical protein